MIEEVVAQVVLDPAAEAVHQLAHLVSHHAGDNCGSDNSGSDLPDLGLRGASSHCVDTMPEEPWNHTCDCRRPDHKGKPGKHLPDVRTEVGKKASQVFHKWHTDCPFVGSKDFRFKGFGSAT